MFDPQDSARVYCVEPGVDLPRALIRGLETRLANAPPKAWAQVEIYVNTHRMKRRIMDLFAKGPARLLPRIRILTDLANDPTIADIPPAVPALRRRLELTQLIGRLLEQTPDLAPRASLFDLADSLAELMDEMHGEGIDINGLREIDIGGLSGYWQRSLEFLGILEHYFGTSGQQEPDAETRQRMVIQHLVQHWKTAPPCHPIIIAGSTGSRGTTAMFMRAVAQLPQGAVVLPGFDTCLPETVWNQLSDPMVSEDHPQFRLATLLKDLLLSPKKIPAWAPALTPANPARNRLISLALRPAPITDQWLAEGKKISGEMIDAAISNLALIEAPSPRAEAVAIAIKLRKAVEDGKTAALITPDRFLTRQVTAVLDRWNITPDDSAGQPFALTAPGRFLRHVSELFGQSLTATNLLILLKHPLCNSGPARGDHLRWTRDLELEALRRGMPFPTRETLVQWAQTKHKGDLDRLHWVNWIFDILGNHAHHGKGGLDDVLAKHFTLSEALAAGPNPDSDLPSGALWDQAAGREAKRIIDDLRHEAKAGGIVSPADFRDLLRAVFNQHAVHSSDTPHPNIKIWGTMEARVQGADLVILAGLNDRVWPKLPKPDPWLNREMRRAVGLLLPDRRIGLSAHDFQQAIAASEVMLTRAVRDMESETIPSRWLLRLTNLLAGLPNGGETVLETIKQRGKIFLDYANQIDQLETDGGVPATRPSPCPPVEVRPKQLSVTRISQLVRDPYAIYCEHILKLRALNPLQHSPDAPLRGTILHQIMEEFINSGTPPDHPEARKVLMEITDRVFDENVPWPAARILWRAKFARIVAPLLVDETHRRAEGHNLTNEVRGKLYFEAQDFTLTATADRIDILNQGGLAIYDYKSGTFPLKKNQILYDKQLQLEAVIARAGGFDRVAKNPIAQVGYVSLGVAIAPRIEQLTEDEITATGKALAQLIDAYAQPEQGYSAMRLDPNLGFSSDFEHLSRYGEWDTSQLPQPEKVG